MSLEMRNEDRMTEFSMDAVAKTVQAAGFAAYVEQTGGGVATIYAGQSYLDSTGDWHWQLLGGPGWFAGDGLWTDPRGTTDDFYVGPDDYGETEPDDSLDLSNETDETLIVTKLAVRIIQKLKDFEWPAGSHQAIDRSSDDWKFGPMYDREIEQAALKRSYHTTWPFYAIKEF